ncbi:MAG: LLM class F420-dependent oxidoreductase, partial [Acidobacteria bacterium]
LVLAKELATLDALSAGRVLLGIGVGWLREEFEAIGVPFESRGRRTDEYVTALRDVWANDVAEFEGEFVKFRPLKSNPKPPNRSIPVIVGGHSEAAARRAARIGDGFFPGRNARHLIEVMIEEAERLGRDHTEIEITVGLRSADEDPCEVAEKMGADRIVINPPAYLPDDIGPAVKRVMAALNC